MTRTPGREGMYATLAFALLASLLGACATPPPAPTTIPPHAVVGVQAKQLTADHWVARAGGASRTVLDRDAIAAQNARIVELDPSVHDLASLPRELAAADVRTRIEALSVRPDEKMYDGQGHEIPTAVFDGLLNSLALDAIPASQPTRFGLAVRRADLRTFPSPQRAYDDADDHDIDRFQESALFPGTPVAMIHESRDGQWWFVVSAQYAAWVEKRHIAEGSAEQVFAYSAKVPYVVVTGATASTVYTPERPDVSSLQLDMGVRVPLLADWPAGDPVNGQHPYTAYVVELPVRAADGSLAFAPALVPRTADVSRDYLPLTRANVVRQGFKFLGERYGWGHSYNARDCSGFVSEVYRSFGVQLPRNTRDQSKTPALSRTEFGPGDDHARRLAELRRLQVGDLVYIPGHVMMVIGHENGMPYVIHDVTGISYRGADGEVKRVTLNAVSVTPLTPLLLRRGPLVDHISSIVRVRP